MKPGHLDLSNLSFRSQLMALTLARIVADGCQIACTTVTKTTVTHVLRQPAGKCTCSFVTRNDMLSLSPILVTCLSRRRVDRVPAPY